LKQEAIYRYRGARAMVTLHERHLRKFLETWRNAKATGVALPATDDPNYQSFDALLRHVLHWAREYMIWICKMLALPKPDIPPIPELEVVARDADRYLEELLQGWRTPLVNVPEEQFYGPEYDAPWKVKYCIDAMLEHAVMHPIRHRFQLMELKEND
jgi:hypothetical protein